MPSLDKAFRSKVARRVFALFVLCAIVPIVGIAAVSLVQVRRQLAAQSDQHLYDTTKGKALAIFERLSFIDRELSLLAAEIAAGENGDRGWRAESSQERFRALAVIEAGQMSPLYGEVNFEPELSSERLGRLANDRSVLGTDGETESLWIAHPLDSGGFLLAVLEDRYLWAVDDLPSMYELTVMDAQGRPLYASRPRAPLSVMDTHVRKRSFRWELDGETFVASTWELPLEFAFGSRPWFVVLSVPETTRLTPVREFTKAFPLVLLLSFWVVLLLSVSQIRRSLDPLERLKQGTARIAARDFTTRVEISSGDEFEELAHSFNDMSQRLGQQFHTLTTLSEIDRAVLSTLQTDEIVSALHRRLYEILSVDSVRITVLGNQPLAYASRRGAPEVKVACLREPSPEESAELLANHEGLRVSAESTSPLANGRMSLELLLPVVVDDGLAAALALGYENERLLTAEEQVRARQLADRFAVALANAQLLEKLDRMNWGSLVALARTIDAKSPWTAGHSERAATLAVEIGKHCGLTEEELDIVHRGGLLHDIGKIGIPPEILDKKGKLTTEERDVMKEHPGIGARILEPIEAYQKYIPVVLQHHEWFDGSGYPDGASGNDISLYARIYAVADVYDALFADRPYRQGLMQKEVVEYIQSKSGTQFDPAVVHAFTKLVEQNDPRLVDRSRHTHRLTSAFADSPAATKEN